MSLNYYNLYVNQVLLLAKTMIIKVESVAESTNDKLRTMKGVTIDLDDKRTWKYYLNLSGQYHNTDQKIHITSLDTLQTIEFNRENLRVHTATARAYEYGSRYYRELITQYPEHETFILGSLYPVDIDKAIGADDFSVLGYPTGLIEDNEVSLVPKINEWLIGFKERWYNRQFNLTDTNYLEALLGVMYLQLPSLIIDLRLRNCRTNEVHSFHVREYLESHGMLNVYLNNMTRKQALFFYRNINYIERNSGKQETFDWLVQKVLTDRNIPLAEFNMHHDVTLMPEELTPKVMFRKRLLNEEVRIYDQDSGFYNLAYILSKEEPTAQGNSDFINQNQTKIEKKFQKTLSNRFKTKVLESSMIDYSDSETLSKADIALNNWIYMSQTNKYNGYINVSNPITGSRFSLTTKEGFLVFLYAYCKANGLKVEKIPPLVATRVPISPVPTRDEVYSVVDKNLVPIEYIDFIISLHKPHSVVLTNTEFKDWVHEHQIAATEQLYFVSNHEHLYTRALVHNAVSRLYQVAVVENEYTGRNFTDILINNSIEYENFGYDDWTRLYVEIYKESTGFDINATTAAADLQKAMISLMEQLSSYSIQFVQSINNTSIKVINWSALRLGDITYKGRALFELQVSIIKILKLLIKNNPKFKIELEDLKTDFILRNRIEVEKIDLDLKLTGKVKISSKKIADLGSFKLNNHIGPYCFGTELYELPLFKGYYDLTIEERKKVKDVYTNYTTEIDYIPDVNLEDVAKTLSVPIEVIKPGINILDSCKNFYVSSSYEGFSNNDIRVTLNGFLNNIDTVHVDNNKMFRGYYKAETFKYESDVLPETNLDGENYTGGYTMAPAFFVRRKDDVEATFDGFKSIFEDSEIVFNTSYINYQIDVTWYNYADAEFSLQYRSLSGQLTKMKMITHTTDAGELIGAMGIIDIDAKPVFDDFMVSRIPTRLNPFGGLNYLSIKHDIDKSFIMNVGAFTLSNLKYYSGSFDTALIYGGGAVIADPYIYRIGNYSTNQTFSAQYLNKDLANKTVISNRTIAKFSFVYIDRTIDLTNWRL